MPKAIRVFNVSVILDATILAHLHVVDADVSMDVIPFAAIIAIECAAEHAAWLSIIIADAIAIVYLKAQTGKFVDVGGEVTTDAVLACLPVAT